MDGIDETRECTHGISTAQYESVLKLDNLHEGRKNMWRLGDMLYCGIRA